MIEKQTHRRLNIYKYKVLDMLFLFYEKKEHILLYNLDLERHI